MTKKKTQKGQWCLTVGDVLKVLKDMDPKAPIAMADEANIFVVPIGGKIVFTDLDDDGNDMNVEGSGEKE